MSVPYAPQQLSYRNGLGISSLIVGIVSLVFSMVPLTGFLAVCGGATGLILGIAGASRAKQKIASNGKTATAGAIVSAIAVVLGIYGMVIVGQAVSEVDKAFDDFDKGMQEISQKYGE